MATHGAWRTRNPEWWHVLAIIGATLCLIGLCTIGRSFSLYRPPLPDTAGTFVESRNEPSGCLPPRLGGALRDHPPADFNIAALPMESAASKTHPIGEPAAIPLAPVPHQDAAAAANLGLLRMHDEMLEHGCERFSRIPGYLATFERRERIGSVLLDPVVMQIKVRRTPFSVYLKWLTGDPGKELLYVEGANDGQMLVRLGGFKGRILPAVHVDPFGSLAMSQSRYSIQSVGILALTESLLEHRRNEIRDQVVPHIQREPDAPCEGRLCSVFTLEVASPEGSPIYRKSIQYIDREWGAVIQVANYTWPEPGQVLGPSTLDEATLIEYYKYSEIVADAQLTDRDFDRSNSEYHF
jgi:Protein of unknown function (DUF1571)